MGDRRTNAAWLNRGYLPSLMAAREGLNPSSFETVRILVVGETGIGKTSLIQLLCFGKSGSAAPHTVGCSCEVKLHEYDEAKPVFLEFIDVGGSQKHQRCRHLFFYDFDAIMLVHDLTNRKSQQALDRWLAEIEEAYVAAGCNGSESEVASFVRVERHDSTDHIPSQASTHVASFNALPRMYIGTKLDQMPHGYTSSYPHDEQGCDHMDVSCTKPIIDWDRMTVFYNAAVQRKLFSNRDRSAPGDTSRRLQTSYSRTSGRRSIDRSMEHSTRKDAFDSSPAGRGLS